MAATTKTVATKVWQTAIGQAKRKFTEIAEVSSNGLIFDKEAMFAMQAISSKPFIEDAASRNPISLRDAIVNVASVGLSLNPALKLAYLVPRDGAICLDISYQGLLKIGTDTGSVIWAVAEPVYSNDQFAWNGFDKTPTHIFDPFAAVSDRGELRGAYCIAKLHDGSILVDKMTSEKIYKVREASKAFTRKDKNGNHTPSGPWVDYFEDMVKKTMIKQAYKMWPKTDRLGEALRIVNEHEGIDFDSRPSGVVYESDAETPTKQSRIQVIKEKLKQKSKDVEPENAEIAQEGESNV